jgi:signal transduction histidine kinase
VRREARIPFADGQLHDTLYSVTGFRTSQGGGVVGVITDITPLKAVQAELERARFAAEAADRTKSAFLATMSHELRTPLNSIIGFTGIVLQGLAGPLTEEQSKQLGMVRDSARHLLALINDVLDISKIEAGELRMDRAPFAITTSLERVIGMARTLAERKGLTLTLEVAPGVGTMVSDARRFEQVLLNLVGNAIKFSEKGEVRVHAQPVVEAGVDSVRVQVHDQGMGIRPEDLATLFTPFRQIDSALSRQHEGTGLGLAICRRLCTLMGGHIGVESVWERGSVFTVTLPLQAPAQGALA